VRGTKVDFWRILQKCLLARAGVCNLDNCPKSTKLVPRRCRDIGREEIRRLWATVWVLPAILPEEGPGAGFGEFSKGRVPPRACGQGGVLLSQNSAKASEKIDTKKELAKIGCFNSILFAHMRVICSYAR